MEDMRDTLRERKGELERTIDTTELTPEQKAVVRTAIEFGYAAAYCEGRAERQEAWFQADQFKGTYNSMLEKLK